jgi:cell division protein ZapA (FtsZ GTPase activity inhibitor)
LDGIGGFWYKSWTSQDHSMSRLHALVLTGMHRSGTSLLASVVRQAGIDMGASLMIAGRGNPRGHFEDLDFHGFHERFLDRRAVSPFAVPDGWSPDPTSAEVEEARELAARRSGRPVWGFKDPRTLLFLDFWDGILEEPFYLFVYRHPVEVALSLLRRGLELEVQNDPRVAIHAWTSYNERLLAFRREHPGRCLLWHVAGAARSLETSVAALSERLGVPLSRSGLDTLYHPDELVGLRAEEIDWASLLPEAFDLYRRLEEAADLPGVDLDGRSPGERDRQDASEHLLAALLRTSGASSEAITTTLEQRRDYTYLRMLTGQLDETNRKLEERSREVELERTAVETCLSLLTAQADEENRKHLEESRRLQEENCRLQERIHEVERELSEIEASMSMRVVRLYWSAVEWARAAKRRLLPGRTSL